MSEFRTLEGEHLGLKYKAWIFPDSWVKRFKYIGSSDLIPHVMLMRSGIPVRPGCLIDNFPPESPEFHIQSLLAWNYARILEYKDVVHLLYTQSAMEFIEKVNAAPIDSLSIIKPPFPAWFAGFSNKGEAEDIPVEWSEDNFKEWGERHRKEADEHNAIVEGWNKNPETMPKYPQPTSTMQAGIDFSQTRMKLDVILGKVQIIGR